MVDYTDYNRDCTTVFVSFENNKKECYPERVISNPPRTIVIWSDGTKTVVKCHDEKYDLEKGVAMAFVKKMLGNRNQFRRLLSNAKVVEK